MRIGTVIIIGGVLGVLMKGVVMKLQTSLNYSDKLFLTRFELVMLFLGFPVSKPFVPLIVRIEKIKIGTMIVVSGILGVLGIWGYRMFFDMSATWLVWGYYPFGVCLPVGGMIREAEKRAERRITPRGYY